MELERRSIHKSCVTTISSAVSSNYSSNLIQKEKNSVKKFKVGSLSWDEVKAKFKVGSLSWDEVKAKFKVGSLSWDEVKAKFKVGSLSWDEVKAKFQADIQQKLIISPRNDDPTSDILCNNLKLAILRTSAGVPGYAKKRNRLV